MVAATPIYCYCQYIHLLFIWRYQFLQVTQLKSERLKKIILTGNALPLNPLLIFVGTNPYLYFKTYKLYYMFNFPYVNLAKAAFFKTFIYYFMIVLTYIIPYYLYRISQFITFMSLIAKRKMVNSFFNFSAVLEILTLITVNWSL